MSKLVIFADLLTAFIKKQTLLTLFFHQPLKPYFNDMFATYELKQIAEKIVPKKYLRVAGMQVLRATSFLYKGNAVTCPCCGHSFASFASYGYVKRPNVLCRHCLSLERHRSLWLYFHQKTNLFKDKLRVLHFAPEHQLQEKFKNAPNLDYISADLDMPTAMIQMDITNITFPDNAFDVIICNHVLEHVPDDHLAMSELYRVLKPGGWAILQTPMSNKAETEEDLTITDPKERERRFGQDDHVRTYGMDKKDRLESVGFKVDLDKFLYELPAATIAQYRLMLEDIWIVRK
jgi:SAM-dependent methyltransferase